MRNVTLQQLRLDIQNQADIAGLSVRHGATLIDRRINQSIQRFRERLSGEGARHFLSYATGRHLEPVDEFVIEDILQAVKKDGYGLRTLIVESLASDIFRSR